MNLEYFGNDKYKVLSCMADCQVIIKGKSIVKLSQQEIADLVQLSKVKVNSIIADLKADGYLVQQSARGRYALTEKANQELAAFKNGGNKK